MFAASKTAKAASAAAATDPQFNYVTMLLHGDGTNGAQNNTFLDSSTNNFTITRNGNTTQGTFTPYGSNWSNYFDGTGDYLSTPNSTSLQWGTGDFCVEAWIFPNSITGSKEIVCKGVNDAGTFDFGLYGSKIELYTTALVFSSTTSIVANTWTHVAVTRSGTTLRCFINGALDTTVTSSYNFNNTGTFYVGVYGSAAVNYFNGYLSNVRCVKGSAVYTSAFTPSTTPLTAITNTQLLTCQSNRFIDNSTNAFTLTKAGDTSVQRFSPFSPTSAYSTSVIGGSGYFDGSGDYLGIANQTALHLGASDFSIECWTYLTSTSGAQRPISQNDTNYEFAFYIANGGGITAYSFQSNGTQNFGINGGTLVIGQWYHLACTRTGSTVAFFVNGVRQGTATFSGTISTSTSGWDIGAIGAGTDPQKGYITDARMVIGSNPYGVGTTLTLPTAPVTAITNTQLLCNFTNAGILDNAMMNDLETVGNAQISTSVKKYGTGSLAFDGTGDYLYGPSSPNTSFGTGDFTIEFWMYSNNVSGVNQLGMLQMSDTAGGLKASYASQLCINQGQTALGVGLTGAIVANINNTNVGSTIAVLTTGTWYHIALVRSSGTVNLYVNGTSVGSATITSAINGPYIVVGGYYSSSFLYNGYLDDVRITKGYARYTSNFTVPTAAFPNN